MVALVVGCGAVVAVGRADGQFRRSPFSSPAASVPMDDLSFLKISRRTFRQNRKEGTNRELSLFLRSPYVRMDHGCMDMHVHADGPAALRINCPPLLFFAAVVSQQV